MPPLRSVISCSPSASARTVTAHSFKAIGMANVRGRGSLENDSGFVLLGNNASRGGVPSYDLTFLRYEILAEIPNHLQIFAFFARFFGARGYLEAVWGGPSPPPPGVSMRSRCPGRSTPVTLPGNSRESSRLCPSATGAPP